MKPLLPYVVGAAALVASPAGSLVFDAEHMQFAGLTTIHSEGARYVRAHLPVGAEVTSAMETASHSAAVIVLGDRGIFQLRAGDYDVGGGPDTLTAGTYFVYLLSDLPMTVTLQFAGLGGHLETQATHSVPGAFHPLSPAVPGGELLSSIPVPVTQRFFGSQSFDGPAITGFMSVRERLIVVGESVEYRWSTADGVTMCGSSTEAGVSGGVALTMDGVLNLGDPQDRIRLDFFRTGVSPTLRNDILGLWVGRAGDDPFTVPVQTHEPLLWAADTVAPDVTCVRSKLAIG